MSGEIAGVAEECVASTTTRAPGRDVGIDALRGLAIVLVVLGHAILDVAWVQHGGPGLIELGSNEWVAESVARNAALSTVYAFHIPLLVFVSGLVFWRPIPRSLGEQLKRRVRGLAIPYLGWFLVTYLVETARGLHHASLVGDLAAVLVRSNAYASLWFLYALFVATILLAVVVSLPWRDWLLPATAAGAIVAYGASLVTTHYLALTPAMRIYPFLVLGYLTASRSALLERYRGWVVLAGGIVASVILQLEYPIHIPAVSRFAQVDSLLHAVHIPGTFTLAWYAGAVAASLALYALYKELPRSVLVPQAWIGRKTLGVYGAHGVFDTIFVAAGVRSWPVLFVLSLGSSLLIVTLMERIPVLSVILLGKGSVFGSHAADEPR